MPSTHRIYRTLYTAGFLRPAITAIESLDTTLKTSSPHSASTWQTADDAASKRRLALVGALDGLAQQETFLDIEPVVGLLSGSDVRGLLPYAKQLFVAIVGVDGFAHAVRERLDARNDVEDEKVGEEKRLTHLREQSYQYVQQIFRRLHIAD
jgi:hypothetical protein